MEEDEAVRTVQPGPVFPGDAIAPVLVTICLLIAPVAAALLWLSASPRQTQAYTKLGLGWTSPGKTRIQQVSASSHRGSTSSPRGGTSSPRIQSLWIYPVKSCQGIELARSRVLPAGLEFDRLFTFAQLKSSPAAQPGWPEEHHGEPVWQFATQRQLPLLATIQVDLYVPDQARARARRPGDQAVLALRFPWRRRGGGAGGLLARAGAKLRGAAPGTMEVRLPVAFPSADAIARRGYAYGRVKIWKDTVRALDVGRELPPELRAYLGVRDGDRLGLFRVDPAALREVHRCAPARDEAGYQPVTGFQDAYPLHLISLASLRDFESKIAKDTAMESLDVRRFRANIVVDGAGAYDEETWKSIRLRGAPPGESPDADFHISCRTVRCKMPNVDPDSGARHPAEPDRSLRKLRDVDEGAPRWGCLGMQVTPLFEGAEGAEGAPPDGLQSWVEVGMTVDVLRRGGHVYIPQ